MWRDALNIDVTISNQEWKVYLDSVDQMNFQMARRGWIGDYVDPNTFLDMFLTGGENNRTGWGDPRYDAPTGPAKRLVELLASHGAQLARLEGSGAEVRALGKLAGVRARVLTGEDASEAALAGKELRSYRYLHLDAGHVCQNLYIAAGSIGAGTCAIGAYDQVKMDRFLDVDGEDEFVIYMAPVGKIRI